MPAPKLFTFESIGTHWWFESLEHENPLRPDVKKALKEAADAFDHLYSRFRPDSLVGELNSHGQLQDPTQELLDMLAFCEEMFLATDGAFNITVGGTLHRLGYGSRGLAAPVRHDFWDLVQYDHSRITIPPHTTIDTGGYGKGWLIDSLAALLREYGYAQFLINGGGDLFVQSNEPVTIGLEHPYDPSLSVGETQIIRGALAVSGAVKRSWRHAGKTYHHIIDPRSESSTNNGVAGVYVRASSALVADVMATVLMIRPDLKAELSDRYDLRVVVVYGTQLI